MPSHIMYYGIGVTVIGVLVTLYAVYIFKKEHGKREDLRGTMKCFIMAALSFTIAGILLGALYMTESDNIYLRFAPQAFYLLGFIFLLIAGKNFKKFSDAVHADRIRLIKLQAKFGT